MGDYITFDERVAYAYNDDFVNKKIMEIAQNFQEECKRDNTLSDEYKAHISDIRNICVNFRPILKHDIVCDFSWVEVGYRFTYTDTYIKDSRVEGTAKVNSRGELDLSDLHRVNSYSSETKGKTGTKTFFSSDRKGCVCHLGDGRFPEGEGAYKKIDISGDASPEYKMLMTLTKEQLAKMVTVDCLPQAVKNELESEAMKSEAFYDNKRNFSFTRVEDYSIHRCKLIVFPVFQFDVFTEFEGKQYICKEHEDPNKIKSVGKTSKHYDEFLKRTAEVSRRNAGWDIPAKILYVISAIVGVFAAIRIWVLFSGNLELYFAHKWASILIVVAMFALAGASALFVYFLEDRWGPYLEIYNKTDAIDSVVVRQERSYRSAKKRHSLLSALWLLLVISLAWFTISFSFKLSQNAEADFYELWAENTVGMEFNMDTSYKSYSLTGGYRTEYYDRSLLIVSCDEEGNAEALLTETSKSNSEKSAQIRLKGKVEAIDKHNIRLHLTFDEYVTYYSGLEHLTNEAYVYYEGNLIFRGARVFEKWGEPGASMHKNTDLPPYPLENGQ